MPWEKIHKVSIATMTVNMALDPEDPTANESGTRLEAVTKDQLNTGLTGQIRYRVSEANLYAFLFGIKKPFVHVMAYFVSVLRQRIANFEAKPVAAGRRCGRRGAAPPMSSPLAGSEMTGISINDLRKNLRDLNEYMDHECRSAPARYGVILDASLITGIDPPPEVESALAAINTAHNQVSSDISLAQAARRSARRAIPARRGDRNPAGAGRGGARQGPGRGTGGAASRRAGSAGRLPAKRAPGALRQGRSRSTWRRPNDRSTGYRYPDGCPDRLCGGIPGRAAAARARAASSASTPWCRSAPAACTCCSARWSACWTNRACTFCPPNSAPSAFVVNFLGNCHVLDLRLDQEYLRSQPVNSEEGAPMGIGIWYEMWISDPVAYPVQEHRPARLAARQRQQRHRALPEQHAAGGDAGDPAQHEPDGARRSHRQVAGVGLPAGLGLHPQGALPRCRHDPADRGEGGEPPAPGDLAPSSRPAPTR